MRAAPPPRDRADDPVPLFGSWRVAYAVVIATFVVEVALFVWFSRYFS